MITICNACESQAHWQVVQATKAILNKGFRVKLNRNARNKN